MAMQWSYSLKKDVVRLGTLLNFRLNDGGIVLREMNLIAYSGQEPLTIKLDIKEGEYLFLDKSYMIPIPVGITVSELKISSIGSGFELYTIILEGDEIQSFPNGGALIIESIRINFNFA